jgi:hypothetical protein
MAKQGAHNGEYFVTLQSSVLLGSRNDSMDQMVIEELKIPFYQNSICCQKLLSLLQQRG